MNSLVPRNFFLFVTPEEIVLYRLGAPVFGPAKEHERRVYPMAGIHEMASVLDQIFFDFKPALDDSWFLGLPLNYFTAVNFSLPVAARNNLDQAVHYGLMRHVPFELSAAYTHYTAREIGNNTLDVVAVVALKKDVNPYLEMVSNSGLTLSVVFPSLSLIAELHNHSGVYVTVKKQYAELLVWKDGRIEFQTSSSSSESVETFLSKAKGILANLQSVSNGQFFFWESNMSVDSAANIMQVDSKHVFELKQGPSGAVRRITEFAYGIDLVPSSVIRRRRRAATLQAIMLFVLLMSLASFPLAKTFGKQHRIAKLEKEISLLQDQVNEMSDIRKDYQKTVTYMSKVAEYAVAQPLAAELLKELTEILPQDVWLYSLNYYSNQIVISGEAKSAALVLELIENSPLFSQARFDSQITRQDNKELFKIVAKEE